MRDELDLSYSRTADGNVPDHEINSSFVQRDHKEIEHMFMQELACPWHELDPCHGQF